MTILEIARDKEQFLPLLLLADEQEDMIFRYLNRGRLFVLQDPQLKALCVVTDEGGGLLELKNLAVAPPFQRRGYGRTMIQFLCRRFSSTFTTLQVGTGDSPLTLPFYLSCGFSPSHTIPNFFIDHYDHPIFEGGKQLVDLVYLCRALRPERN